MTKPIRIQRKRTKGWRKPPNTLCVTRPGKFGNPFDNAEDFRRWLIRWFSGWRPVQNGSPVTEKMIVIAESLEELRGKNLACYCDLSAECHANILLEFANR